jgi:hypothetical protein
MRMGVIQHFRPDTPRSSARRQGTGLVVARPKGHATKYAPLLEPVKKDMNGVTPGYKLGARRRTAGSRSGGRRQLAGATGTTRSAERRRSHARSGRSGREAGLPRSVPHRRAPRASRTARSEHAVVGVITAVVMPENYGAGKEYDRQDENDPGDNHNPRRGRVEPGRLGPRRWRRWRRCGDGSRLGRGFGCFTHALNIAQAHNRRDRFRQQNCCELTPGTSVPVTAMTRSPALGRAPGYWLWVAGPQGSSHHPVSMISTGIALTEWSSGAEGPTTGSDWVRRVPGPLTELHPAGLPQVHQVRLDHPGGTSGASSSRGACGDHGGSHRDPHVFRGRSQ